MKPDMDFQSFYDLVDLIDWFNMNKHHQLISVVHNGAGYYAIYYKGHYTP